MAVRPLPRTLLTHCAKQLSKLLAVAGVYKQRKMTPDQVLLHAAQLGTARAVDLPDDAVLPAHHVAHRREFKQVGIWVVGRFEFQIGLPQFLVLALQLGLMNL